MKFLIQGKYILIPVFLHMNIEKIYSIVRKIKSDLDGSAL